MFVRALITLSSPRRRRRLEFSRNFHDISNSNDINAPDYLNGNVENAIKTFAFLAKRLG